MIKLFVLKHYEDVNKILESLRQGYTIAIIETKILRQKDPIELKRAISKIKKTTDALEGSIVGFRENIVIATPSFARVDRESEVVVDDKKPANRFDEYLLILISYLSIFSYKIFLFIFRRYSEKYLYYYDILNYTNAFNRPQLLHNYK